MLQLSTDLAIRPWFNDRFLIGTWAIVLRDTLTFNKP